MGFITVSSLNGVTHVHPKIKQKVLGIIVDQDFVSPEYSLTIYFVALIMNLFLHSLLIDSFQVSSCTLYLLQIQMILEVGKHQVL